MTFFEGCDPGLGTTVVLRGGQLVLGEIKRILKFAIRLAYSLRLESALLFDAGVQPPASFKLWALQVLNSQDKLIQRSLTNRTVDESAPLTTSTYDFPIDSAPPMALLEPSANAEAADPAASQPGDAVAEGRPLP